MPVLVLGSQSPRRKELLSKAGFEFDVRSSNVDETLPGGVLPEEAVLMLAERKSEALEVREGEVVLTSDTVVAKDDLILGKPSSVEEAFDTLRALSGETHQVWTGVTIRSRSITASFAVRTDVTFFQLEDKEIRDYLKTDEAWDKAGGYGIQGKGGLFVEKVNGDYYSVVGLPIARVVRELKPFGIYPS
ncbi:septum formation protein Maf [Halobacillus locisalis]|uniref:dTTP/UTP pyrophosphatase n=1 Tax=Halobacillus locisalis TaxID=220753 RepID=A0A838CNN2_9BACI|nr:Maf family protein [Halobacillus locisalis]MBA2173449.1 septum formation protein Maf [Halobacillus locisalis]